MGRRRKFGFSFSPKRALGISSLKQKVARATGIPTTRAGRQRKVGRALGCSTIIALAALAGTAAVVIGSSIAP